MRDIKEKLSCVALDNQYESQKEEISSELVVNVLDVQKHYLSQILLV